MITPYNWQVPAINKTVQTLQKSDIILNCSDTGTGKTIVALDALRQLNRKALIICPKAVTTAWARTIAEMKLEHLHLGTINAERLRFKNPWFKDKAWHLPDGAMIIWDEIHRGASGIKSQTTKRLALTRAYNIPIMGLSATVADSPLKMRGVGYLLELHKFNPNSYYNWCRENGCSRSKYHEGWEFFRGSAGHKVMQNIHDQVADRMVRMRIKDIDDFPGNQVIANLYTLDKKYTDEINEIYETMDYNVKKENSNALVELMRARQRTELIKVPLLRDLALEAVDEGKSPVLFVNFTETQKALSSELRGHGQEVAEIFGAQNGHVREENRANFQANTHNCMVAMSQCGGVGIDMHDVHQTHPRVSFLTPSYNAIDMVQCLGRIHRAGGTKVVQTFVLIGDTVEERVHRSITGKLKNIRTLNDGDLT